MTLDLSVYDIPLTGLEQQFVSWVAEALDLRFGAGEDPRGPVSLPAAESGQREVLESLIRVRQRLDRVEGILSRCTRARGRVSRASAVAKAAADGSWDEASNRSRNAPVTRGPDYSGPRERYADANLETISEQRAARAAARLASVADESVDVVRLAHRGLEGLRQDHLAIYRGFAFASHIEQ